MKIDPRRTTIAFLGAAVLLVGAGAAHAAPVSKCNAAKKKCIGKYVAAVLGCHAKAESKGVAVDPACIAKAVAKITGGGKGCFDKQDAVAPNDCGVTGSTAVHLSDADGLVADIVNAVDPAYPTPTLTKCGAARKKCVGKKAAGLMGCSAKLSNDGIGNATCAPKIMDKFGGAKGCDPKALTKRPDCLGTATTAVLEAKVDAWAATTESIFDYVGPVCGNGVIDAGEFCDPAAPQRLEADCGSDFACNPTTCNCACPTSVHFVPDAASSNTVLDVGWTGISHGTPVVTNADVTVALSGCAAERPCGVCAMSGPTPNVGATELRSRRCTNDTSIRCSDDTPCLGGGGTCAFYFGTNLPLSAGGVTVCAVNRFNGLIVGTVNLETGDAVVDTADLISQIYSGAVIDEPCPLCVGDATLNDDVQDGTCASGDRGGFPCDANGTVPGRPDFGATSLDCPQISGALLATLPIDLSSATAPVTKTLTASSPTCSGSPGDKCLCDTCNNANQEPCSANADCPDPAGPIGPICGGRRCLGGPNVGAACTANTACPGGICVRPGEPTRPMGCIEDSGTPMCSDLDGDGTGECLDGPVTTTCSAPHAQRGCINDADCTPGTCESANRTCFRTGGNPIPGFHTGTLVADGMVDTPVHDAAAPTLGSVFCVAPTSSPAVNNVAGLPGPARLTLQGDATARP